MNLKIILPILLVLIIGIIGVVFAGELKETWGGTISGEVTEVSVNLEEGWNLIYGFANPEWIISSEISSNNIKAIFLYELTNKEYIRIYPNPEKNKLKDLRDDYYLSTSVFWVYSDKSGKVEYNALEPFPLNERRLSKGWNFVAVTPDMFYEKNDQDVFSWNGIKGNCNFEKIYAWNPEEQDWMPISADLESFDFNDFFGSGMVVRVTNDCTLGISTGGTSPPGLPIDCQEDDGGKNVNIKGTTTGMSSWIVEDEGSVQVSITDVCEEDVYENYLREYYCLNNIVQNEGIFCPEGTTCLNGACIQ